MKKAQDVLDSIEEKYGFVPNVLSKLVHNPVVAEFYLKGGELLSSGVLSQKEQQAIMLAVSVENECDYCSAAHSAVAKMSGMSSEAVSAITSKGTLENTRLSALVDAAKITMEKSGWLTEADLQDIQASGVTRAELYEIIAIIGLKTVTNYINHFEHTEIDEQFK